MVHAAIDIGVLARLVVHQAVDYRLRHLTGCGIVEINQRFPLDLEIEDRKISANAFDVERRTEPGLQGGLYNIHCSVSLRLLQNDSLKPMFERIDGYAVDDLRAKRVGQQVSCCHLGQTAALEIKQFFIIELANRCAVGALYVIREDLKLWLGIDTSPPAQ
jgi:hypothetical protein